MYNLSLVLALAPDSHTSTQWLSHVHIYILRPEKFSGKNSKIFQAAENTGIFGETHFGQLFCEKFFAKITNLSINGRCAAPIIILKKK